MILVRGGGDLASGVIYRLYRAGITAIVTELPQPLVVRRLVSFAEAVYRGEFEVEGVPARRVETPLQALSLVSAGVVPVLVDPPAACRAEISPLVLIDGRLTKNPPELGMDAAQLVIGLGPGFVAGANCHAVIETNRGHMLGRVIWNGSAQADTGIPEAVARHQAERVLRAPASGSSPILPRLAPASNRDS
jgi:xanthine dehydrogenase accessory factor